MKINMSQFHAAYFEEAAEHLATLEAGLLQLESEATDPELLHTIFRAAHSIKGSSGTFGFPEISGFTHGVESLLDLMRDGTVVPTSELIGVLLRATDHLDVLLAAARKGGPMLEAPEIVAQLKKAVIHAREREVAPEPPPEDGVRGEMAEYRITFAPASDLLLRGMDPLLILRELSELGELDEVCVDTSRIPPLADLEPECCCLAWTLRLKTQASRDELRNVFLFVEDDSRVDLELVESCSPEARLEDTPPPATPTEDCDAVVVHAERKKSITTDSIRVSVEKVDELINLVGELVIANSMVRQSLTHVPLDDVPLLQEAMAVMDRSTRDLQDQVMAVRMMPVGTVFRRFPRLVRDLATKLAKQVHVTITGEEIELDKQVIEEIGDPLTHLLRNCVDHGIEPPEDRRRAGKSEEGHVRLGAFHEGGNVIIEIGDDGRGLNSEAIRTKAISQGILKADDELTDAQIHELIFHPGLSTAATVTDVSGRGVGMDVVKRNVEALNGSIGIFSTPGEGTRFRIKLPLTMAILDGLSASVNEEIYILPLLSVVESFRPRVGDVKTVTGRGEVVVVRGEAVPLVRLYRLFHRPARATDPCAGLVIIAENQGRKIAILVDELLGQLQVVMKSLEANYRRVEGISGATILGDGRVAFILDIAGLMRLARN